MVQNINENITQIDLDRGVVRYGIWVRGYAIFDTFAVYLAYFSRHRSISQIISVIF